MKWIKFMKETELQLMKPADQDIALAQNPVPNVADMLQAVIKGGVSNENVAALEKLVGLYERMQDRDAEKLFSRAFSDLQGDIPRIKAVHIVPDKNGNQKFKVAKFEEMMEQLAPLLLQHKFTLGFKQSYEKDLPLRITVTCILQHTPSGHKTETPFTARVGSGPPGCSEFQADGAASSYCKMRALCQALNILIDRADEDPRALGKPVTEQEAKGIMARVKVIGLAPNRELSMLKWLGINIDYPPELADYMKIMSPRVPELDKYLKELETKAGR